MIEDQNHAKNNKEDLNELQLPEFIVPEDVKPILEKLPAEDQIAIRVALSVKSSWRGPTPPPEILAGYNEAIPNGAERILKMSEKQSEHRMEIEKTVINRELNQSGRGQNYAFIIVIIVLLASVWLIYIGKEISGTILGSVDLVALATVFIIGKYAQKNNIERKK